MTPVEALKHCVIGPDGYCEVYMVTPDKCLTCLCYDKKEQEKTNDDVRSVQSSIQARSDTEIPAM